MKENIFPLKNTSQNHFNLTYRYTKVITTTKTYCYQYKVGKFNDQMRHCISKTITIYVPEER